MAVYFQSTLLDLCRTKNGHCRTLVPLGYADPDKAFSDAHHCNGMAICRIYDGHIRSGLDECAEGYYGGGQH